MCGIVGIAGRLRRDQLLTAVNAMNVAVAHRGPDDEGAWVGENFAFGMRRLSIIDLAGGHQPMWDSRTGIGIVYNGEVYNYKTLRAGLEKSGISLQTASDSEVVLKTLALKGADAVHDWNGMFAVAAWNDREKKLLLIRDRIGVKPLYYYWDGSILLFASEIKALLASNLFSRRLNRQAVWDYLTYRYVPGPETMWQNIWKLPPGHMLEWSPNGEPRLARYWSSDVVSVDQSMDIGQKTKEFEDLFLDSVAQRLLASDVPVGVMLSGGLDSSSIAAAAVELGHKQFHTFSVGFAEGGEYSELGYARQVARHLGVENHEVVVDQSSFLEMLPHAVQTADEPLADLTIVPLLAVCQLARGHVKVALSGEGADEVLAGYNFNLGHRKFETIRRIQTFPPSLLKAMHRALALLSDRYADKFAEVRNIPLSKWNIAHKNHISWIWDQIEKMALWPHFVGHDSGRILRNMYTAAESPHPLDQILCVYQQSWLVEDLLMKADKMSMAASLELRVPFLDYRLVEWANRQPIGVKIGRVGWRNVTKRVLRRFAKTRLPREIIDRPKKGFPVPVRQWLQDDGFSSWAVEHLLGKQAKLKYFFQPEAMKGQLCRAATGDLKAADKSWLLIVLETWLRGFDVEVASDIPSPSDAAFVAPGPSAGLGLADADDHW
jgi:asparagine synthase (glutamine-hydrolysing)